MKFFFAGNGFYREEYERDFLFFRNNRLYSYYFLTNKLGIHLWKGYKSFMELFFAGTIGHKLDKKGLLPEVIVKRLFSYHHIINDVSTLKGYEEMLLYYAGTDNKIWQKILIEAKGDKALYSYHYIVKQKLDKKFINAERAKVRNIFIDSGGFSAFTQGVKIDLQKYIDWIHENKSFITTYANLDIVGDYKASNKNLYEMERRGLKPLPVFHYGEDFRYLSDLTKSYKYIAIGGMVPISRQKKKLWRFLDQVFAITQGDIKLHGFGMTGREGLKKYPFYSVDSTSWLGGSMRSEIYRFIPSKGDLEVIKTKDKLKADHRTVKFNDRDQEKRWFDRVLNNSIEWMKYERFITELWEKRGVKFES